MTQREKRTKLQYPPAGKGSLQLHPPLIISYITRVNNSSNSTQPLLPTKSTDLDMISTASRIDPSRCQVCQPFYIWLWFSHVHTYPSHPKSSTPNSILSHFQPLWLRVLLVSWFALWNTRISTTGYQRLRLRLRMRFGRGRLCLLLYNFQALQRHGLLHEERTWWSSNTCITWKQDKAVSKLAPLYSVKCGKAITIFNKITSE